jgi:hypothetical protein
VKSINDISILLLQNTYYKNELCICIYLIAVFPVLSVLNYINYSAQDICIISNIIFPIIVIYISDHLCGLVVRVPGYRSRGLGSIPGAIRILEK